MIRVKLIEAEALKLGPDDVLIVKFAEASEASDEVMRATVEGLEELGIKGMVFSGDVEFVVKKKGI